MASVNARRAAARAVGWHPAGDVLACDHVGNCVVHTAVTVAAATAAS